MLLLGCASVNAVSWILSSLLAKKCSFSRILLSKALTAGQPVGEQSKNKNFELDPSTTSTMYVKT